MTSERVPCVRCNDTGLIEYTAGTWVLPSGTKLTASERHPVYVQCDVCKRKPKETKRRFE